MVAPELRVCFAGISLKVWQILVGTLNFRLGHPLFFLRLAWNAFPDFGSVSRIKKKRNPQNEEETVTRGPGTPTSLPWSLETTRCGYKINVAAKKVEEDKIDVVVKVEIGIQR